MAFPAASLVGPAATVAQAAIGYTWRKTSDYMKEIPQLQNNIKEYREKLEEAYDNMKKRVDRGKRVMGMEPTTYYDKWKTDAEKALNSVRPLLDDPDTTPITLYCYGKRLVKKSEELKSLVKKAKEIKPLEKAEPPPVKEIKVTYFETARSNEVLKELLAFHEDNRSRVACLWGGAKAGKSTILKVLNNKIYVDAERKYDAVIYLDLQNQNSADGDLTEEDDKKRIKRVVHETLKDRFDVVWEENEKNSPEKQAERFLNILRNMNFFIILDGLTRRIELESVGIPTPNEQGEMKYRHKVVISSFDKELSRGWGNDDLQLKLDYLTEDDSLHLFLSRIPEFPRYMYRSAKNLLQMGSGGVPQTVISLAAYMKDNVGDIVQWQAALDAAQQSQLHLNTGCESERESNSFYNTIRFIYKRLKSRYMCQFFLFCTLFPINSPINTFDLTNYWHCLGEVDDVRHVLSVAYISFTTLVNSGNLLDWVDDKDSTIRYVKMNYMHREAALRIVRDDLGESWLVKPGFRLQHSPQSLAGFTTVSLIDNDICELVAPHQTDNCQPGCYPDLKILLVSRNRNLTRVDPDFFIGMQSLRVLDMSRTGITALPEGIVALVGLAFLDISFTQVTYLPKDVMRMLKKLKHLGLRSLQLTDITALSEALQLQVLLLDGKHICSLEDLRALEKLHLLDYLSIDLSSTDALQHLIQSNKLRLAIRKLGIIRFDQRMLDITSILQGLTRIKYMDVMECGSLQLKIGSELKSTENSLEELRLVNIRQLKVSYGNCDDLPKLLCLIVKNCRKMVELNWAAKLPNLRKVILEDCSDLKTLVDDQSVSGRLPVFGTLQKMTLKSLPKLQSIVVEGTDMASLTTLKVKNCMNLKRLPMGIEVNGKINKALDIIGDDEWWNGIEWVNVTQRMGLKCKFKSSKDMNGDGEELEYLRFND